MEQGWLLLQPLEETQEEEEEEEEEGCRVSGETSARRSWETNILSCN